MNTIGTLCIFPAALLLVFILFEHYFQFKGLNNIGSYMILASAALA